MKVYKFKKWTIAFTKGKGIYTISVTQPSAALYDVPFGIVRSQSIVTTIGSDGIAIGHPKLEKLTFLILYKWVIILHKD